MGEFKGKCALVTGASRGIGRACALALGREGAFVIVNYNQSEKKALETVALIRDTGGQAQAIKADVSSPKEVNRMRGEILESREGVDLLVNNAGIHQHLKTWELSNDDWERVLGVNLSGVFNCTKAFIPEMRTNCWGRIVNIASVIANIGTDHEIHYAASKGGVVSATKALALELAPYSVRANAVSPGLIETDMLQFESDEEKKHYLAQIPQGRVGKPEEIADAVVFLCSNQSSYITGQVLHVNGGFAFP